jgi:hypothetical protein
LVTIYNKLLTHKYIKGENVMSWTIKIKHTRPNTGVEFYVDPVLNPELRATENTSLAVSDQDHITATIAVATDYTNTGKLASSSQTLSENELELIKTFVFDNEASRDAFVNDSTVHAWLLARNSYNTTNSISKATLQDEVT